MTEVESAAIRHALTDAQSEVWLAQQLDPGSAHYNVGVRLDFSAPVDPEILAAAVDRALADTAAMRCRFGLDGGDPHQVPLAPDETPLRLLELPGHQPEDVDAWIRRDLADPLDLLADQLQRYTLLTLADGRHILYLRYHHILLDGFSLILHLRRLAEIYSALAAGRECPPPAFGDLADLVRDERAYRASGQYREDRAYWLDSLSDHPDPVSLGGRFAPSAPSVLRRTAELSASQAAALRGTARRGQAPWSLAVIAATAAFLHGMTSRDDLMLALPVTARTGRTALTTPGMTANELPLRLRVRPSMSFAELLEATAEQTSRAVRHHRFRGEELRRELGVTAPEALRGPMVNIVSYQDELAFGEVTAKIGRPSRNRARDLNLIFSGAPHGGVRMDLDANPNVYDEDQLASLQDRFLRFVHTVTTDGDRPLGRLNLLTPEERRQLPALWSGPTTNATPPVDVVALFEERAAAAPDAIALVDANEQGSYGELNARANQIARWLREQGAGPERFVAVDMPRGVEAVTALLGVLKSGAAYLPLDPDYPAERTTHILTDA
ncbi:AMP-binding enzyme, partial [Streptomyces zhaozhouensis]